MPIPVRHNTKTITASGSCTTVNDGRSHWASYSNLSSRAQRPGRCFLGTAPPEGARKGDLRSSVSEVSAKVPGVLGVAIPQFIPLLFVHSVTGAWIAAAPIGLT
jgi:hypothetical protein